MIIFKGLKPSVIEDEDKLSLFCKSIKSTGKLKLKSIQFLGLKLLLIYKSSFGVKISISLVCSILYNNHSLFSTLTL